MGDRGRIETFCEEVMEIENVILIRYGEIYLKGLNRPFFEQRLMDNVKKSLKILEM